MRFQLNKGNIRERDYKKFIRDLRAKAYIKVREHIIVFNTIFRKIKA